MCWCGLFDLGTMCDAMAGLSILPILGERLKYRGTTSTNKTAFHAFMFSAILSLSSLRPLDIRPFKRYYVLAGE